MMKRFKYCTSRDKFTFTARTAVADISNQKTSVSWCRSRVSGTSSPFHFHDRGFGREGRDRRRQRMELGYALDLVLDENSSLREEISQLREWVIMLRQQFGIHRFAASDKGTVIAGRSCNNEWTGSA